jgi:NTE family protein
MTTTPLPAQQPASSSLLGPLPRGRGLVLGGGGSAGNAWLIGIVAGLCEAGLDLMQADVVVGTSAGATAAAQLTGSSPAEQLAAILSAEPAGPAGPRPDRPGAPAGGPGSVADHLERTGRLIATSADPADMRRRLGAASLALDEASDGSSSARWRAIVAARLPSAHWPATCRLLVTAIDARTGEPVVFDRDSGVDLVDAVAASTSNGSAAPPYAIGTGRYLDGAYRRNENADLATGCARVLVLSPLGGRFRTPPEWRLQLAAQVDDLRASGSAVEVVVPDEASLDAFGANMMRPSSRPPAARAGHRQGIALAASLGDLWSCEGG